MFDRYLDGFTSTQKMALIVGACVVIAGIAWFAYTYMMKKTASPRPSTTTRNNNRDSGSSTTGTRQRPPVEPSETNLDAGSDPTLVLVYAEWCGHCKDFMPTWDDFVESTNNGQAIGVRLVKVSGPDAPEVVDMLGIKGFPTLVFMPNGLNDPSGAFHYLGERSIPAIRQFLNNPSPM